MNVSPVTAAPQVAPSTGQPPQRAIGGEQEPFGNLMSQLLNEVNKPQVQADQTVKKFLSGETDSINDVVLSVAKADLTFRLFMEIRNRLISSYQEIQRMQV